MPGKGAFKRCVESVGASGSAVDPRAVCASSLSKTMGRGELQRKAAAARGNSVPKGWTKQAWKKESNRRGRERRAKIRRAVKRQERKNILPLDFGTASLTGQALSAIEKQRERLEKKLKSNKSSKRTRVTKLFGKRTTFHGKIRRAGGKVRVSKSRKNAANPVESSRAAYAGFHGRPSEMLVEIRTPVHEHTSLAAIGDLIRLKIKPASGGPVVTLKNFGKNRDGQKALLCMNEGRGDQPQLFIDGGDQSVDLDAFGIEQPFHEFETLGKLTDVWYFTTKDHLRPQDGGTANYHHEFGKGSPKARRDLRACPDVLYDVRSKLLSFSGGRYTLPDEGIDG